MRIERTMSVLGLRAQLYSLDKGNKPLKDLLFQHNTIIQKMVREGESISYLEYLYTFMRAIPQLRKELENVVQLDGVDVVGSTRQRKKHVVCHHCRNAGHKRNKCLARKRKPRPEPMEVDEEPMELPVPSSCDPTVAKRRALMASLSDESNIEEKVRGLAERKLPLQCCIEPGEAYNLYDVQSFNEMYDEAMMQIKSNS